ncbi:DUF4393 domain-containing protein [Bacillus paranthracis]|uniref:DUF4393 domain-containing protein n=1 Tax=Bacillus paranthracis TaxID=2026186 RepID=UPI004032CAF4
MDNFAEKTQFKRVHALNQFKEEVERSISAIPEENIVEPPLHIVGPTLEAAKYYFENDELKSMFANLIAASINIDTIDKAHPSFVEIIKQLSPLDAKNLKCFQQTPKLPIAQYNFVTNTGSTTICQTNVFLENDECNNIKLNATSISNLSRLGLVSISYDYNLIDLTLYERHLDTPFLQGQKTQLEIMKLAVNTDNDSIKIEKIDTQKGIVEITPFGDNFITICL